ncbi:MAG: RNA methyltransferase [Anaerolineaceae bacterium]|nr:RNA methyltransferase [Anaerolineaceae bacterium]
MITSISNQKVKWVRDLLSAKKHRDASRMMIVEGVRLAEEALSVNSTVHLCLYSKRLSERGRLVLEKIEKTTTVDEVSPELMDRISDTKASQGILLILPYPNIPLPKQADPVLVLDKIQDPGNMGTILRTAAALGVGAALLTPGTTDPFAPKVMRSAMGAQFKLPIRWMDIEAIGHFCKQKEETQIDILIASADCPQSCWEKDLSKPICLVIGSEAKGVSDRMRQIADGCLKIPLVKDIESLNAAISAGILLYEIQHQRKKL